MQIKLCRRHFFWGSLKIEIWLNIIIDFFSSHLKYSYIRVIFLLLMQAWGLELSDCGVWFIGNVKVWESPFSYFGEKKIPPKIKYCILRILN